MHRRNRNDCRSYHSWDSCVLAASVYDRPIPWGKMVKNLGGYNGPTGLWMVAALCGAMIAFCVVVGAS
jgi:hypothetical protein